MDLALLIDKIRRDKGFDLSGYKESTVIRRLSRRMLFDGAGSLEEYIRMIDNDHHLYWRLVSDFFIGVTDFFRDKDIWKIVQERILPDIIKRRATRNQGLATSDQRLATIWSAGCSSGEETYSLAIALSLCTKDFGVEVCGTDIMEDKLESAKKGIYSREKLKDVDSSIRLRYFEQIGSGQYMIDDSIKRITRFQRYDLADSGALTGFDMVICRNVLIYFQPRLQEKVIGNFYNALMPGGILWLGKSEALWGMSETLFEPVFERERIFRKK